MKTTTTSRGFGVIEFTDAYGKSCSVQESSSADRSCIWLGIDDAEPSIMASQARSFGVETDKRNGWVPFPIPEEVSLNTRMHLTREQVKELLPILKHFVKTGELPNLE